MRGQNMLKKGTAVFLTAAMLVPMGSMAIFAEGEEATGKAMSVVALAGTNYYYVDTTGDAADITYTFCVTTGRGPSAVTTPYSFKKEELKQVAETEIYYIVNPGSEEPAGSFYGKNADGTVKTYTEMYTEMGVQASAEDYDAISSATCLTGYHAKDISGTVVYGEDADGNKIITGVSIGRSSAAVDAGEYVEAGLLQAAGMEISEYQKGLLAVDLNADATAVPSESAVTPVVKSATYTTSRYGFGEFAIEPDDTVSGYVWSNYWDSVYAVTISDGTTTTGAVHWIDAYGEAATSGPHYNKIQIALNNGTSIASNQATVNRFAAFMNEDGTDIKDGKYTITVYADGYENLIAQVIVGDYVEPMTYEDVKEGSWYYDYVRQAFDKKLMTGLNETTFGVGQKLSRAQMAMVLYRLAGSPEVTYEAVFPDVAETSWYASCAIWCQSQGIITGYENKKFGPADLATREQMATMLMRYAKVSGADTTARKSLDGFEDVNKVSGFAKEAMEWCYANGYITGKTETKLDPRGLCTREECATILARFTAE